MINRESPAGLGSVVWLVGLLCVGCSGTPLGDQLTERLSEPDDPVEETAAPGGAAINTPTGDPLTEQPSGSDDPSDDPVEDPSPANPTAATTQAPPPVNPTPYRLLLRLPAADPAAPAEAVTQALRGAGILFEVETIERLPNGSPPPPLTPSP